jgi:hypothetical protein
MINRRDTVLIRLLFASCRMLSERGASGVFVDCINGNESGFEMLGESNGDGGNGRLSTLEEES